MKVSLQAGTKVRFTNQSTSMYIGDRLIPLYGGVSASFGIPGDIYIITEQSDGKVILGGNFLYYKDVYSPYIVRILPNGEPDPDFNVGTGFNGIPRGITQQADGKILAGGSFTSYSGSTANRIVRLNPSGTIDPDFKIGAGFSGIVYSIYKQLDNKIVAAGQFTTYSGSALNNIVRINLSGSVDSDFSIGTGLNTTAYSVYQQSDGKILVGGEFISASGVPSPRIARYNISGGLDSDFATGSGFNTTINSIIQQSDNKIVAVGTFTTYSGSTYNRVIRLNLSGGIDPDFSIGTGASSDVTKVIQQSDGKLIIIGIFGNYSGGGNTRIARINTSGSRDTTFSVSGLGNAQTAFDIIQKSDGTILMGGEFTTINGSTAGKYDGIIQLNDSGSIYDTTQTVYPNIGLATGSFATVGTVLTVATQSDGKILIGGTFQFYKDKICNGIIRLNSDYEPDPDFNIGLGSNNYINKIKLQPDNKILLGGNFTTYSGSTVNYVVRLNPSGTIDPDFKTGTGFNSDVRDIDLEENGKILLGGNFTTYSGSSASRLVRLNPSGTIDLDFSPASTFNGAINTVIKQPDSKILFSGAFSSVTGAPNRYIARFNASGSLDLDFITSGSSNILYSIILKPDYKIVAVGALGEFSGSAANRIIGITSSGSVDTDFNIGSGLNTAGTSLYQQSDSKILVGGTFTSYSGSTARRIVRLNPSGTVDTTFKSGVGFSYGNLTTDIYSIIQLQNNKILIGGAFSNYSGSFTGSYDSIIELNDSGSISNANFYGGVRSFNNSVVTDMIQQQDGKLLFVGNLLYRFQNPLYYTSSFGSVVRFNTDYTVDTTFKSGVGFNITAVSLVNSRILFGLKVAEQKDGKLIFISCNTRYSGSSISNNIVRTTSSGSIDPDFKSGTGFSNVTGCIYIQKDGKILVGGNSATYSGSSSSGIVRILPSGSIDPDFKVGSGASGNIYSIYEQFDGKILVGGQFSNYSGSGITEDLTRLTPSGSLDLDFNETGSINNAVYEVSQQSDGKILIGGNFTFVSGAFLNYITRLNPTGSRDTTFNIGTGLNNPPQSIIQQQDGKILIGGFFTTYSGSAANYVVRLNESGSVDTNFSASVFNSLGFGNTNFAQKVFESNNIVHVAGGLPLYSGSLIGGYVGLPITSSETIGSPAVITSSVVVPSTNFYGGVRTSTIVYSAIEESTVYGSPTGSLVPNGKVLLGGNFTRLQKSPYTASYRYITRLLNDGNVDLDFKTGAGFNNSVFFIKQQLDGKILVGGFFQEYSGSTPNRIVRLNLSGSIDPDFKTGVGFNTSVYSIYQQSDGKILAGGDFTTYSGSTVNRIVRLNPSGTIDPDFTTGSGLNNTVYSVYQQTDGKILVGGNFTTASGVPSPRIVRYNLSGSIDSDFISGSGFNDFVKTLYQQSDNKILVGGRFTTYSGSATQYIIRLNTSGNIDTDFKIGVGTNSTLNSIYQQSDGKILAGGDFTTYSGSTVNRIVRLNPSGTIDPDFKTGTAFNSSVESIVQQSNGNILVAGSFSRYSGSNYLGGFAGLTPSGSIATYTNPSSYLDPLTLK
jgi:uncharacterized delta-60 repeat protein